jgi:hypothetical protein
LNADGSVDTGFDSPLEFALGLAVRSIAVRPDGRVLIGGEFASLETPGYQGLRELNPDGSYDYGFNVRLNSGVSCVALRPDGLVLAGGPFTFRDAASVTHYSLTRVTAGGGFDFGFTPDPISAVETIALQADGRGIYGGAFATITLDQIPRNGVARINGNGAVDFRFDAQVEGRMIAVALQPDGKILIGGNYTTVAGARRYNLARLLNDPAVESLEVSSTSIRWLRGGTAPETRYTGFELSVDGGAHWSTLGAGVRIPGGWEKSGLSLPANGMVRARGRMPSGMFNGSEGALERVKTFPAVVSPPVSLHAQRLADGSVQIDFEGTPGIVYQVVASDSLRVPIAEWTELGRAVETSPGHFRFLDTPPGGIVFRYYAIRAP